MAIIDEGSSAEERHNRGKDDLREMAEADWIRQEAARKPKKQAKMFR